ncbi:DUF393 domain-containing protein [bacterium]|nr:DUF393 domain-containing protein [bacterium]
MMQDSRTRLVVYFDGVCNLCNRFVDFLVRIDRARVLRYAPIQGETARARGIYDAAREPVPGSIVVQRDVAEQDGERWTESDAVIRIFTHVGGIWSAAAILRVVPRTLRNAVYRTVARNRYRIFGRRDTCRVPSDEEKALFLP